VDGLLEVGPAGFEKELVGEMECVGGGGTNDGGGGITKGGVEDWCLGGGGTTVKPVEGLTVWLVEAVGMGVVAEKGGGTTSSKLLLGQLCE
jgi:hypothetical protein